MVAPGLRWLEITWTGLPKHNQRGLPSPAGQPPLGGRPRQILTRLDRPRLSAQCRRTKQESSPTPDLSRPGHSTTLRFEGRRFQPRLYGRNCLSSSIPHHTVSVFSSILHSWQHVAPREAYSHCVPEPPPTCQSVAIVAGTLPCFGSRHFEYLLADLPTFFDDHHCAVQRTTPCLSIWIAACSRSSTDIPEPPSTASSPTWI